MLIEYDDGTKMATCSMHCTAAEFAAHREKTLKRLQVSDHNSNRLIDAKKASQVASFLKVAKTRQAIMTYERLLL